MTKSSDVHFGRRGGHEVPAGVEPGKGLEDLERIRAAARERGDWPDAIDNDVADDGQLDLFS